MVIHGKNPRTVSGGNRHFYQSLLLILNNIRGKMVKICTRKTFKESYFYYHLT